MTETQTIQVAKKTTPKIYKSPIVQRSPLNPDFQILLFYKYTHIEDPQIFAIQQRAWCDELGLKGRTLIGQEGINSTLEGTIKNTEEYIKRMSAKAGFEDIHWKKSVGTGKAFPKIAIRVRDEIVSTHVDDRFEIGPHRGMTGQYLEPQQLHDWIHSNKEFYIVDMRNDYEYEVGHFVTQKNVKSILPEDLRNFRDLPKVLPLLENLKDKTVVTVCTGGIRCEKASGFLVKHGFKDVYQLNGGIVSYMEKYPNQDFLGKLYVFDNRMAVGFNTESPEHTVVGKCRICGATSENSINYKLEDTQQSERYHGIICQNCIDNKKAFIS
jgi:UPF0176 protein